MSEDANWILRPARRDDAADVLAFIKELATYEKLEHEVVATLDDIEQQLFGAQPAAEVMLADTARGPIAFALYFHTFSTFLGRPGLYLEDLYVQPEHRGRGVGRALLVHLAGLAVERGCGRFEWAVLDWNESAIGFYLALGAVAQNEWSVYRLSGTALQRVAGLA